MAWRINLPLMMCVGLVMLLTGHATSVNANDANTPTESSPPSLFDFAEGGKSAEEAQASQQAWAAYDNVPVDIENAVGMAIRLIPPGAYLRGSPADEPQRSNVETQHHVTLTRSFHMAATEVTQAQWQAVMGTTLAERWRPRAPYPRLPNNFGDDLPMYDLSWDEAVAFCAQLTLKDRAAGRITAAQAYRLPTEAEWEYACRAGTTTMFHTGDGEAALDAAGWHRGNSSIAPSLPVPQKVGTKAPNAFGLYDMHGNVLEWCHDWYGVYPDGPIENPTGPLQGTNRVRRGGSYDSLWHVARAAKRDVPSPKETVDFLTGFRVVLDVAEE